jgi:hypothetical protein
MKNNTKAFIGRENEPKNEDVFMGVESCLGGKEGLKGIIAQENNIRMNLEAKAPLANQSSTNNLCKCGKL